GEARPERKPAEFVSRRPRPPAGADALAVRHCGALGVVLRGATRPALGGRGELGSRDSSLDPLSWDSRRRGTGCACRCRRLAFPTLGASPEMLAFPARRDHIERTGARGWARTALVRE